MFAGNSSGQFLNVQTDSLSDSSGEPAVLAPTLTYGLGIVLSTCRHRRPRRMAMSFSSETDDYGPKRDDDYGYRRGPDCTTSRPVPEPASLALGGSAVLLVAGSLLVAVAEDASDVRFYSARRARS